MPVLIVGINERLVKISKNPSARLAQLEPCVESATPYFSDDSNDYYFYDEVYCGGGGVGGTPGGGSGGTTSCDRDLNTKFDHVNQVKFASIGELDRAESWATGAPELYFIVYTGSTTPYLQQVRKNVPKVDRSKWKDCGIFNCVPEWVFTEIELFHWLKSDLSETIAIQWFEYDGGGTSTFKYGFSSKDALGIPINVEYSTTININDDNMGVSIVNYCDKAAYSDFKIQSSSSILFGLRLDD